ncbi:MAG: hypothetical protein ACR2OB_12470 [Solirubrobacteraceae bacterium]
MPTRSPTDFGCVIKWAAGWARARPAVTQPADLERLESIIGQGGDQAFEQRLEASI